MAKQLTFRMPDTVAFRHSFFSTFPDALFRRDAQGGEPVLVFELGDQKVMLPFDGFKREFSLTEATADAVMLNTVSRSLDYVSVLSLGDPVPAEVLTGNPSWAPDARHIADARNRITAELVGWNLAQEVPRDDQVRLRQFLARYVNDETIRFSLLRLAAHFGDGAHGATRLSSVMNDLAEELAYIETLRERTSAIASISDKLVSMRRDFVHHASVMSDLEPVARMIAKPVTQFRSLIREVDTRLSDVVSAFTDPDAMQLFMRRIRDDLARRLSAWEPFRAAWDRISVRNADPFDIVPALRDLYRFLAPRYMPVDEWTLVLSGGDKADSSGALGSVVTWYEREPHVA